MLQINKISKTFGAETILDQITFTINPRERIGLVGANGCGKTTLLRIITGEETADSGSITLQHGCQLGYLAQGISQSSAQSVADACWARLPDLAAARAIIENTPSQAQTAEGEAAYQRALTQYQSLGGYAVEARAAQILAGLNLAYLDLKTPMKQLSGGEGTRVGLAALLLAEPDILLLDEPTNHLDIDSLEWLENFLQHFNGAVLVVSHDRVFLDRTAQRILEIHDKTHTLREFSGNYSTYAEVLKKEREKQWANWKDQQAEIKRLKADIVRTKNQAISTEKGTNNDQQRRYAKKVAKKAKSKEARLERYIESAEMVEKPQQKWRLRMSFGETPPSGKSVLRLTDVGHGWGGQWLFRHLDLSVQQGERIAIIGANGMGKSTLVKLIMGELAPLEGGVNMGASVRLGYMPQQQETLPPEQTALAVIQAVSALDRTEIHHFLHYFLFEEDDVYRPVGLMSYGERARLLLARLVASGSNTLILDEPVNHLDIPAREQFEKALDHFEGTVLIVAHDRAFINRTCNITWQLKAGELRKGYV